MEIGDLVKLKYFESSWGIILEVNSKFKWCTVFFVNDGLTLSFFEEDLEVINEKTTPQHTEGIIGKK